MFRFKFSTRSKRIGISIFLMYVTAPISCSLILLPFNILTSTYCAGEGGGIRRNGKYISSSAMKTNFEQIIASQGGWGSMPLT